MPFYYYLFLIGALSVTFILLRFFVMRKKNIAVELFAEAVRNENSADFEAALVVYARALEEVRKIKCHHKLELKIVEKIKLLHAVVDYDRGLRFIR